MSLFALLLSPSKFRFFQRPKPAVTDESEREREREPDIATVGGGADPFSNGTDEPDLRHTHDGAKYAEEEGGDGSDTRRQEVWGGVYGWVVTRESAFEDEVLGEGDPFVDGEPVALRGSVIRYYSDGWLEKLGALRGT